MDTDEEIKKLKEEIKELSDLAKENFDYIFECGLFDKAAMAAYKAGNRSSDDQPEIIANEDLVDVVSFDVKKKAPILIAGDWMGQEFAFKVKLKNNTPQMVQYNLTITFEDGDGFESSRQLALIGNQIKGNETASESGIVTLSSTDKEAADNYREINCVVEAYMM